MSHFDNDFKNDTSGYKVFKFYNTPLTSVTSLDYILDLMKMEANRELYNFTLQDFLSMDLNTFLFIENKILEEMAKREKVSDEVSKGVKKEFSQYGI